MDAALQPEGQPSTRQRISSACEACRLAKLRCQPSSQGGICRRCHEQKKECVFRTGPRTRRSRTARAAHDAARLPPPPPPGPSKTFTIDFPVSMPADEVDDVEGLAHRHEQYLDDLINTDEGDDQPTGSFASFARPLSPPTSAPSPAPASSSRSAHSLGLQPQFNFASAEALLANFRSMLIHFPCIALPADATVSSMARTRPFVLLSLLAASSGRKTLQGHSLYDEEFRKILGFKFVAGGERSLELLQGLLIYVAWYPFHLRPKNRQAFQYVKMAVDIVYDLELYEPPPNNSLPHGPVTDEEMDRMRAYLSCYYLISAFSASRHRRLSVSLEHNAWMATCANVLEQNPRAEGDVVLCWLVRMAQLVEEATAVCRRGPGPGQSDGQIRLMLRGLESQLKEWQRKIPPAVASIHVVTLATTFTELFIHSAPLLKRPPRQKGAPSNAANSPFDPDRLQQCLPLAARFFDYVSGTLKAADVANFSSADWARFVLATVASMRLSFPLAECPAWDSRAARSQLRLKKYLDRLCEEDHEGKQPQEGPPSWRHNPTDVVSASRMVINVVRRKYEQRVEQLESSRQGAEEGIGVAADESWSLQASAEHISFPKSCPMSDTSLQPYLSLWDDTLSNPHLGGPIWEEQPSSAPENAGVASTQPMFHDLWATMTMSWTADEP